MEVLVVPAGGTQVVRKTAALPGERERLLREAEVLRAAAERGVNGLARVVAWPSDDTEPCLVTEAVAGPSLAAASPMPVLEVAGVAAEVARLLAGLHQAGLVHGAVEPGHVVLDGEGGVLLVGLGAGGAIGASSVERGAGALDPTDDVAGWGMLVAHLLDWSAAGEDEPLVALRRTLATRRGRRGGRRLPGGRPDEDERRVLAALADQAQDPDPARRPSARSLAVAVPHRIPAARVPGAAAAASPGRGPAAGLLDRLSAHVASSAASPAASPAAAATTAAAGPAGPPQDQPPPPAPSPARHGLPGRTARRVGAGRLGPNRPGRRAARAADAPAPAAPDEAGRLSSAPAAAVTARSDGPVTDAGVELWPATWRSTSAIGYRRSGSSGTFAVRRLAAAGAAAALVVLGGSAVVARLRSAEPSAPAGAPPSSPRPTPCAAAAAPAADVDGDGCEEPVRWADGVLHAGVARFAVGGAAAAWAVGDWNCDGRRTLALLDGGGLAVFDAWPGPGAELQGRRVTAAGGATEVAAVAGPDGCERPALRRPGSADHVVDVGRTP